MKIKVFTSKESSPTRAAHYVNEQLAAEVPEHAIIHGTNTQVVFDSDSYCCVTVTVTYDCSEM
jgi:hypothetical protein